MNIEQILAENVINALQTLYDNSITANTFTILIQTTKKEFKGDFTLVVFPFLKISKKTPPATAQEIGTYLQEKLTEIVADFNVVNGFLNLTINQKYWLNFLYTVEQDNKFGFVEANHLSPTILVEYSSPNTNKPLHLGHIRNNLIGYSIAEILKANGNKVIKVNLVNDRGIHICKSMLAWLKYGKGETPESSNLKGDHLVGKYYVLFDKQYKAEINELISIGKTKAEAEKQAPILLEAQEMLRKWEAGDIATITLWKKMNKWVYKGFEESYKTLGVNFDKFYYESETYLLGKKIVEDGLTKKVFFKKADGSAWIDLTSDGLDEKVILRADGTSVYITQDLGTAALRFEQYNFDKMLYVVGNEQDYHFKVLQLILKKLNYKWANGLEHISYGMVELPEGKMKSREGTVVDADDLINEMILTAEETTKQLGKTADFSTEESIELFKTIALGALKYFMLKVDPKKKMLFNPQESIDFNGNTGPLIQYTYARIQSILRKAKELNTHWNSEITTSLISEKEIQLIKLIYSFQSTIKEAGTMQSPAIIANYTYELAKEYNQFYHELPILKEENVELKNFRLALSSKVGDIIKSAMKLLGISVPQRM